MRAPLALFRCDASPSIGAGHVGRCLALAEALDEVGWRVGFVVGPDTLPTAPALSGSGFDVRVLADGEGDLPAMGSAALQRAALVVVDHYGRDRRFEQACRVFGERILAFDDATGRDHDCDVLLDAGASDAAIYAGHVPTRAAVLAGPAYALMRRSFVSHREQALARRDGRPVRSILVSCGATDPLNCTEVVLEALADIAHGAAITVALSSRAPHLDAVRRRVRGKTRLLLDADDMAELMTAADLAVGTPGTTSYERAVTGLPSIFITVADNQRGLARMMAGAGAAVDAGPLDDGLAGRLRRALSDLLHDAGARQHLSAAARRLVDGRGAMRVMLACLDDGAAKDGAAVRLRLADVNDEEWLLELQRQPSTRRFYRNPAVPSAAEHHEWLAKTLNDRTRLLLMIEVAGGPVGVLRLDRQFAGNTAARYEVSIAIDIAHANRRIGSVALVLVRRLLPAAEFEAHISPENVASRRAFARAGYRACATGAYCSAPAAVSN